MLKTDQFWDKTAKAIQTKLNENYGLSNFLQWPPVASTMYAALIENRQDKLFALQKSGRWDKWQQAIKEHKFGGPIPCPIYTESSENAIQQAYHLSIFEEMSGVNIEKLGEIVEVGGGYGACAKIIKGLEHESKYSIIDLPTLVELQIIYLANVGVPNVYCTANEEEVNAYPDLFLALHSLSESPLEERERILNMFSPKYFFFAFGAKFNNTIDNLAWFNSQLPEILTLYRWVSSKPLGNTYYMLGEKIGSHQSNTT